MANALGAQHQGHHSIRKLYLGGFPGVSPEARGIPWGIPAGSCIGLLGDLIREGGEAHGASIEEWKGMMSSPDEPSPRVLGRSLGLGSITCGHVTCGSL